MGKRRTKNKKDYWSGDNITKRAKEFLPPKKTDVNANRCFVVDGTFLAYTAYYAHHLRYKGKSTSIMFGVVDQIRAMMNMYRAHRVIVCWDGAKDPKRMELLPSYKSHRTKNMTDKQRQRFKNEVKRTQKLLYYLGIAQAYNPGLEGDDMVYWVTKKMQNLYKVWIISGDKDFGQLVNYDVQVYNPRTKYTTDWWTFRLSSKVEIYQYVDFLCMVGDKSDDIPGYRGIGEVRAMKFLMEFGSIKNFLSQKDAEFSGVSDKELLEKIWKRNRKLIDLKRFNEKYHSEKDITYIRDKSMPKYQVERLKAYAMKYGIKTFTWDTFLKPFQVLADA